MTKIEQVMPRMRNFNSNVLKIGPTRPLFLFIFGLFKQTIQFLQQMNVKNVMSIQYLGWDSNPRPLERESTPITTRPGLYIIFIHFVTYQIRHRL